MNYGYVVMFAGFAVLAALYVYDVARASKLRKIVWAELDNAWDGGCFNSAEAGYLHEMTPAEVAADMELYCDAASGYDRNELLPHVAAWMARYEAR